jgi:hypothetical protein
MKLIKHATLLALAATFVSATASASASYFSVEHGISCSPAYGSQSIVGVGEPGIGNYSSSQSARVFCAAPRYFYDITSINIEYTDANASQNFSCYGFAQNMWSGSTVWSNTRYTCSQYGGCPDATTSYTGYNMMTVTFPGPQYNLSGISCTLPPTAPYASWVANVEYLSNSQSY